MTVPNHFNAFSGGLFIYIFGTGYQLQMLGLNPTKQKSNTDKVPKLKNEIHHKISSWPPNNSNEMRAEFARLTL